MLPHAVLRELERLFPGVDSKDLQSDLPSPSELRSESDDSYERVLLAIVSLSLGDRGRLARLAADAKRDWRDVVYWAEHPQEAQRSKTWEELQQRLRLNDRRPGSGR